MAGVLVIKALLTQAESCYEVPANLPVVVLHFDGRLCNLTETARAPRFVSSVKAAAVTGVVVVAHGTSGSKGFCFRSHARYRRM